MLAGTEISGGRGRGRLYLTLYGVLHCHHQNDSCIKMGILMKQLIMMGKVTRQCPQTTTFEERRAEAESIRSPSAYQPSALPLGQTGPQIQLKVTVWGFTINYSVDWDWSPCRLCQRHSCPCKPHPRSPCQPPSCARTWSRVCWPCS